MNTTPETDKNCLSIKMNDFYFCFIVKAEIPTLKHYTNFVCNANTKNNNNQSSRTSALRFHKTPHISTCAA